MCYPVRLLGVIFMICVRWVESHGGEMIVCVWTGFGVVCLVVRVVI